MLRKEIDLDSISKNDIEFISNAFLEGSVIVYPTDTVYGLGCLATDKKAIRKIEKIKNRFEQKSYILLTKSFCMTKKYAKVSKKQDEFLRSVWVARTNGPEINKKNANKPTTVILEARPNMLPKNALKDGTLAFRLPKNDFLSKILMIVDLPIVSTSLNISGQKPLSSLDDIETYFRKTSLPDLVVDAGKISRTKTSEIIDIRDIENIKKIR
ncbi:MAG: L-threonylcarbamoyladenylate synthase [Patescibacteria group bacterium]|jgi:L-threonylcarbamoyladenylate synthase|nr:L-threonylcarbamoyladenylate synthase [Patescibacteria group bacterium]